MYTPGQGKRTHPSVVVQQPVLWGRTHEDRATMRLRRRQKEQECTENTVMPMMEGKPLRLAARLWSRPKSLAWRLRPWTARKYQLLNLKS